MKLQNNNSAIKSSIFQVLVFFDIFKIPLTPIEIYNRLLIKCSFKDMMKALQDMSEIETKEGLYFLKNKEDNINFRKKQYILSQKKWLIAKQACKILRFVPGLKMVAVCNNFSYKETSDIDLFIITEKKRIWLTRFLVTAGMHLSGLRRHDGKIANRICLSFYVSLEGMNLRKLLLKPGVSYNVFMNDPYFLFWMADLMTLYDDGILENFYDQNKWFLKTLPNFELNLVSQRIRVEDNVFSLFFKKIVNIFLFSFLEKIFKCLQMKKMKKNYSSKAYEDDTRVVISDTVLKFHEEDRREEYREEMLKNFKA